MLNSAKCHQAMLMGRDEPQCHADGEAAMCSNGQGGEDEGGQARDCNNDDGLERAAAKDQSTSLSAEDLPGMLNDKMHDAMPAETSMSKSVEDVKIDMAAFHKMYPLAGMATLRALYPQAAVEAWVNRVDADLLNCWTMRYLMRSADRSELVLFADPALTEMLCRFPLGKVVDLRILNGEDLYAISGHPGSGMGIWLQHERVRSSLAIMASDSINFGFLRRLLRDWVGTAEAVVHGKLAAFTASSNSHGDINASTAMVTGEQGGFMSMNEFAAFLSERKIMAGDLPDELLHRILNRMPVQEEELSPFYARKNLVQSAAEAEEAELDAKKVYELDETEQTALRTYVMNRIWRILDSNGVFSRFKSRAIFGLDNEFYAHQDKLAAAGGSGGLVMMQHPGTKLVVPMLLSVCITFLEQHGLDTEGLLRLSGESGRIVSLAEKVLQVSDPAVAMSYFVGEDIPVVAGLLKYFFRNVLSDPLINYQLYRPFLASATVFDESFQVEMVKDLIALLPVTHQRMLCVLLKFCQRVIMTSRKQRFAFGYGENDGLGQRGNGSVGNRMDAYNLAIIFAPNILRRPEGASAALYGNDDDDDDDDDEDDNESVVYGSGGGRSSNVVGKAVLNARASIRISSAVSRRGRGSILSRPQKAKKVSNMKALDEMKRAISVTKFMIDHESLLWPVSYRWTRNILCIKRGLDATNAATNKVLPFEDDNTTLPRMIRHEDRAEFETIQVPPSCYSCNEGEAIAM